MHMLEQNKLGAFAILLSDAMSEALDDLSPSAAALLTTLHYRSDITITELADVAGIAQPTAVRVLDGLVRGGLIERKPKSGRQTPLALTSKGWSKALTLRTARLKAMGEVLSPLSPDESTAFEAAIDRMLAAATTSRAFARRTCRLCAHDICNEPDCPLGTRASEIERDTDQPKKVSV